MQHQVKVAAGMYPIDGTMLNELLRVEYTFIPIGKTGKRNRILYAAMDIAVVDGKDFVTLIDWQKATMPEGTLGVFTCSIPFDGWYVFDLRALPEGGMMGFYKRSDKESALKHISHLLTNEYKYFEKTDQNRYILKVDGTQEMGYLYMAHIAKASEQAANKEPTKAGDAFVGGQEEYEPTRKPGFFEGIRKTLSRFIGRS